MDLIRPHVGRADWLVLLALGAITAYFALLTHAVGNWSYDSWMVLVLAPLLLVIGGAIIVAVTRGDELPLTGLIFTALVVKLGASFLRYYVAFELYDSADANRYDLAGGRIADAFHEGELDLVDIITLRQGTQSISDLTGLIYSATGPSRIGGFLIYSWIGFFGLLLFHRAMRVGFPEADQRRYALLVFFLPSMVFWPSSIGKESVMILSLGLCALGAARLLERHRYGWLPLVAGLAISFLVRPHVCVVVLGALAVAAAFRRRPGRTPTFGPAGRIVLVILLVASMSFVFGRAVESILPNSEATGTEAVGELLDRAEEGTDEAGSEIDRLTPTSPIDYPQAVFSVLFRPTLVEASNVGSLLAALETTLVLGLSLASLRRLRHLATVLFWRPYVLFCMVYTGIFTLAWSSFANLGALARQRVQLWPFFLIVLAIPLSLPSRSERRAVRRASPFAARPGALVATSSARVP